VEAPSAKSKKNLAITLTHTDMESQFLCCTIGEPALYQGDCCLTCAVEQAHEEKRAMTLSFIIVSNDVLNCGVEGLFLKWM
jgi:hypothetical protein